MGSQCSYRANDGGNQRTILGAWDEDGDGSVLRSREGGQGEADKADRCGTHGSVVGEVSCTVVNA